MICNHISVSIGSEAPLKYLDTSTPQTKELQLTQPPKLMPLPRITSPGSSRNTILPPILPSRIMIVHGKSIVKSCPLFNLL